MTYLITELSNVMQQEVKSLAQIAQNTANANSVGYKSQRVGLHTQSSTDFMNLINQVQTSTGHDTRVSSLNITNNKADLALLSEGWFGVEENGELFLTRNGSFSVNSNGLLTTKNGALVQGVNGNISGVTLDNLIVNQQGHIYIGSEQIGTLAVYEVSSRANLESKGNSLYKVSGEVNLSQSPKVIQGSLESSNVDTSQEMLRIVETTRHIETMQRAMASYDELLKIGITQIGK